MTMLDSAEVYDAYEARVGRGGAFARTMAGRFFMRDDPVNRTLTDVTSRLAALGIPYAVVGGMALVAHGYERTTTDVDILLTPAGLAEAHRNLDGLGYLPPFPGSRHLRDATTKVKVEFLVAGQYPGDGKPQPYAFPDPADVSVDIDGIRYVRLPTLVDLKLASGITGGVNRLKDLADVVELIRVLTLPESFADQLSPYTRPKFAELWQGLRESTPQAE